ncbi:D-alanine--D-alanine ligase family protein [Nocardioides marmorisolisilvae]|uniref:D-alanine--D-alanine ligase n=1 Tax=Nocardioides marmorisolisilvae TaxID=1542737 RepID=A0A3N0DW87_9ACTN|nr:D-alanine--D-alanine ligase family protein [Nocardioides marmorisolisilvae]RNL79878.1 D-alanine--D-alanine ligase [Nocardioides marmorisolisilvae]
MSEQQRIRVAVVFGGRSSEHAISCVSAGSVIAALDPQRYEVIPVGITTDGRWVLESNEGGRLALGPAGELPAVSGTREVALSPSEGLVVSAPGEVPSHLGQVDVVFPVMHGPWGQDGTLQGLLELAGVRYVGAGVLSSAVGTDKAYMKLLFAAAGLPVQPWVLIRPGAWDREQAALRAEIDGLGYPVFVKPARAGSSFGITRVDGPEGLDDAVAEAIRFDPKVLVEAGAMGAREVEIGVLQGVDGDPETSAIAEIRVDAAHAFYDFEAKYLEDSTALDVPADLDEDTAATVRAYAVGAFRALDVEGLARVDFFLMPDGRVVVNEVETMPGFTATSMFPRMWAASGLDYPALVDRLVQLALQRSTGLR